MWPARLFASVSEGCGAAIFRVVCPEDGTAYPSKVLVKICRITQCHFSENSSLNTVWSLETLCESVLYDFPVVAGTCLFRVGEHTKAKAYLMTAIELSHQEGSYVELAKILLLENDIQGAIGIFNAALE
jgi:tetratricopeptide (TPR) repeat protein